MIINNKFSYKSLFLSIWLVIIIIPTNITAQTSITGAKITNQVLDTYGSPIDGVEIGIKGSGLTSTTNTDGVFELAYTPGDILTYTHDRFLYHEAKVSRIDIGSGVKIHLQEKPVNTPGYITGPYGEKNDRDSYVGSESTVYTSQLTKSMGTTIIPGITGRIAGLNVIQGRGTRLHNTSANASDGIIGSVPLFGRRDESDNSEFFMSARGQAPIVIVDGIRRDFYSIDPDAIESISLQKDALSSMFLGMQSSRGALIITTKDPVENALHVSFTSRVGINSPVKMPKPLNAHQYAWLLNEALQNDGKLPIYSYDDFSKFKDGSSPYLHPNVNWYDELLNKNSVSQYYNLNVSGGNNVARYFVSLGYTGQGGLFKTSPDNSYNTNLDYQRYLITSKVDVNITDDFTANITLIGRIEDGNQPGGNGDGYSSLLHTIFTTPNTAYPIRNPNGSWGGNISFTNNLMSQTFNSGYIKDSSRDILGSINLDYDFSKIVQGLSVSTIGSITTQSRSAVFRTKRDPVYAYTISQSGNPSYAMYGTPSSQINNFRSVGNYQDMYFQLAVNYKRQFGLHDIGGRLMGDTRTILNNYDLPEVPSNIIGDLSYRFDNKYFAQAALAESYYNRYAPGKRWGTFYSIGLGWDVSKESFMESWDNISRLKLRGVYGLTGNGITNSAYYIYRQTYSYHGTAWYPMGTSQSPGNFTTENQPLANPNITWEKARKVNIGVDLSLFNDKIEFTSDFYVDNYFDLLQSRGKSIELMGAAYPAENIGKSRLQGVELSLAYQNNFKRLNYYISGNWNIQYSKVLFMDEQEHPHDYLYRTGKPVGAHFGLTADGFLTAKDIANGYPVMQGFDNIQPGDVKYIDKNKDGVIDEFDVSMIGGDKPLSFFGIDIGLQYKGFEFSMLWQGVYNRDIYLGDRNFTEGFLQINQHYGQAFEHMQNRWTPENASNATLPRLSAGGNDYNYGNHWSSSLWMKSGNFIRLKNMYIAYNLPETISRNYLSGLRVKFFMGTQNLFTFSAIDLVDPEVGFTSYPLQKNINFGVNVKF
ncbi:MAG: SusC/RagA family TonB-linked outer membrane protein [Proteiniphilum sp.]